MVYTIADRYHNLVIRLTTALQNTGDISLEVYKSTNETSTADLTVIPTVSGNILTFTIPNSHFNIGDVLDRFKVISENSTLEQLNEGVTIYLDGVEADTVSTSSNNPSWKHTFNDEEAHTVQAVFKGNTVLKPYFDTPKQFKVSQKELPTEAGLSGAWKLTCLTNASTFNWRSQNTLIFELTRGGNLAPDNKIVEVSIPGRVVVTKQTKNGQVKADLSEIDAGTYNITARFWDYTVTEGSVLTAVTKKITIKKATPTITFKKSTQTTDNHARFYVRGVNNEKLANVACTVWVNGKKKTTKLSDNGNIGFTLKKKGTYKFKVKTNATKNYNSVTMSATETKS